MIKSFYINKATYRVQTTSGKKGLLTVNYWDNSFKSTVKDKNIQKIAINMLKKKHRVDFAWKFQDGKMVE